MQYVEIRKAKVWSDVGSQNYVNETWKFHEQGGVINSNIRKSIMDQILI
jgi:hypothetical protein